MKILITGATSGIGEQLAVDYLRGGHDVFCCGRKISALSKLEEDHPDAAHLHSFDA